MALLLNWLWVSSALNFKYDWMITIKSESFHLENKSMVVVAKMARTWQYKKLVYFVYAVNHSEKQKKIAKNIYGIVRLTFSSSGAQQRQWFNARNVLLWMMSINAGPLSLAVQVRETRHLDKANNLNVIDSDCQFSGSKWRRERVRNGP